MRETVHCSSAADSVQRFVELAKKYGDGTAATQLSGAVHIPINPQRPLPPHRPHHPPTTVTYPPSRFTTEKPPFP